VEVFDRSDLWGSVKRLWRLRRATDTLVLSHSINPLVALFFCLANAPASAGYLWSHAFVALPEKGVALSPVARTFGPLVEQRLDVARALGLSADPVPPVRFTLGMETVGKEIRTVLETLARKRNEGRRIVALAPGSRSPNRRWPATHFETLGHLLLKRPEVDFVIVGGPEDIALATALGRSEPRRVIGAAGRTGFMEFAALIGASDVVVCNDSAALHVAAALRVPCVGIFGPVPSELRIHAMEGYRSVGLTGSRPCLCGYDFFSEKPCAHGTPCLTSLSPERVAKAVDDLLGR
jgi:ADP-heptose:LPS heptosyltransferase